MNTRPSTAADAADTIVYCRTALGHKAARDPAAGLPRMLKTLLLAVDGKTSVERFQVLLPNFGDVAALLEALVAGRMIEPTNETVSAPRAGAKVHALPTRNVASAVQAVHAAPASSFAQTQASGESHVPWPAPATAPLRPAPALSSLMRNDGKAYDPYAAAPPNQLSMPRFAVQEEARVREARTCMSAFLFDHLPEIALEVTLALERLETTEQMQVNLAGYQNLIAKTGRQASEHIAAVRAILSN